MYNFGVVVDDASMGITHVLRAQDSCTHPSHSALNLGSSLFMTCLESGIYKGAQRVHAECAAEARVGKRRRSGISDWLL